MLEKYKYQIVGFFVGAILGLGYWYFMGKDSNTNPVDGSPILSAIWGSLIGIIISTLFKSGRR